MKSSPLVGEDLVGGSQKIWSCSRSGGGPHHVKRAVSSRARRSPFGTSGSSVPRQFTIYSPRSPELATEHLAIYQPSVSSSRRSETPILLSDGSLCVCRGVLHPTDSETSPNESSHAMLFPIESNYEPLTHHPGFEPLTHPAPIFRRSVTDIPRSIAATTPLSPIQIPTRIDRVEVQVHHTSPFTPQRTPTPTQPQRALSPALQETAAPSLSHNVIYTPRDVDTETRPDSVVEPAQIEDVPTAQRETQPSPTTAPVSCGTKDHMEMAHEEETGVSPRETSAVREPALTPQEIQEAFIQSMRSAETENVTPVENASGRTRSMSPPLLLPVETETSPVSLMQTKSIALDNVVHTSPRERHLSASPSADNAPIPTSFLRSFVSELAQDVSPPIFSPRRHASANDSTASTIVPAAKDTKATDRFAYKQRQKHLPLHLLALLNSILTLLLIYLVFKHDRATQEAHLQIHSLSEMVQNLQNELFSLDGTTPANSVVRCTMPEVTLADYTSLEDEYIPAKPSRIKRLISAIAWPRRVRPRSKRLSFSEWWWPKDQTPREYPLLLRSLIFVWMVSWSVVCALLRFVAASLIGPVMVGAMGWVAIWRAKRIVPSWVQSIVVEK